MPDDNPDIATRTGLPDALRILLKDHPRAAWDSDPGFHGLVSFWLERHLAFRDLMAAMQADAEKLLDARMAPDAYAQRLARLGGHFVNDLHGHHQIEDTHYFPLLAKREPRIARGFDMLDADHHALDAHLETFIKGANAIIGARNEPVKLAARTGRFRDDLLGLNRFLDRHLVDEEDLIVPIILKHGEGSLG